jgi:hypothetical protein
LLSVIQRSRLPLRFEEKRIDLPSGEYDGCRSLELPRVIQRSLEPPSSRRLSRGLRASSTSLPSASMSSTTPLCDVQPISSATSSSMSWRITFALPPTTISTDCART